MDGGPWLGVDGCAMRSLQKCYVIIARLFGDAEVVLSGQRFGPFYKVWICQSSRGDNTCGLVLRLLKFQVTSLCDPERHSVAPGAAPHVAEKSLV